MPREGQPPRLSLKDLAQSVFFGGSDWSEDYGQQYEQPEQGNYCDKGGHRERSVANQPQHQDHWKKEEKQRKG